MRTKMYDVDQVADKLGVAGSTVRRWAREKRIDFTQVGARIWFTKDQVEGVRQGLRPKPTKANRELFKEQMIPESNLMPNRGEPRLPPGVSQYEGSHPTTREKYEMAIGMIQEATTILQQLFAEGGVR